MKKRALGALLTLALCLGLCSVPAGAAAETSRRNSSTVPSPFEASGEPAAVGMTESRTVSTKYAKYTVTVTNVLSKEAKPIRVWEETEKGMVKTELTPEIWYIPRRGAQCVLSVGDSGDGHFADSAEGHFSRYVLKDGAYQLRNDGPVVIATKDGTAVNVDDSYDGDPPASKSLLRLDPQFPEIWLAYSKDDAVADTPLTVMPFTDVKAGSAFAPAISWAVGRGITKGTTPTTFSPGNTCTHNHILTFIWRANGSPEAEGENDFARAAAWAEATGIAENVTGSAPCTRAEAVTYLWRLADCPEPAASFSFTDVLSGAPYAQAVAWAVSRGITNGTEPTTFSPERTCTRGQIMTFLFRWQAQ